MALGPNARGIRGLAFLSATKPALAGCVIGLLGAAATAHWLDWFLFGVSRFDPLVLTTAAILVEAGTGGFVAACAACRVCRPDEVLRTD